MVFKTAAGHSAFHEQILLNEHEGVFSVGEDAFFNTKDFIGVSDGVSRWSIERMGNSAYLAYYLMAYAKLYAENGNKDTKEIILKAYEEVWERYHSSRLSMPNGSATICLVRLIEDGDSLFISYASVGDSMVVVLRPQLVGEKLVIKVAHQSARRYVNVRAVIPMQLLFSPLRTPRENVNASNMETITETFSVCSGDIVVVATDGLWDNLSAAQTARTLSTILNKIQAAQQTLNKDSSIENEEGRSHNKNCKKGRGACRNRKGKEPKKGRGPCRNGKGKKLVQDGDVNDGMDPVNIAKRLVERALQRNKKSDDITVVVGVVGRRATRK